MRGFTLVELLVVVLIIGLGISVIGISVGNNSGFQMQNEARQFANNTALMGEEAVLANRPWGVDIFREAEAEADRYGYRWLVLDDDNQWVLPSSEEFAKEYHFSEGLVLRLQLDGLETEKEIEFKQEIPAASQKDKNGKQENLHQLKIIGADNAITTDRENIQPEIWLMASGEKTAFNLTVFKQDNADAVVEVIGDELGRIQLLTGEEEDDL